MNKIKLAYIIIIINVLFFITYNTFFGWNMQSLSIAETNCDNVFKIVFYFSLWIYFLPLVDVYEKFIKEYLGK